MWSLDISFLLRFFVISSSLAEEESKLDIFLVKFLDGLHDIH